MKKRRKSYILYWFVRTLVWIFYPKIHKEGMENIPDEPVIFVGNHTQMNGPIMAELYFPGNSYTWTAGEMMSLREVPDYAYRDFWSGKPRYIKWFFRAASYLIAPVSVCIFNNARCIGVHRDVRLLSTFRETVKKLQEGSPVIIFPEHNVPYNNLVWEFQDKFVDVAGLYYRKTGKDIDFVPMYVAPRLRKIIFGRPVTFDHTAPAGDERKRICKAMADSITGIAGSLPEHTVVPYPNMPSRHYPTNKEIEGYDTKGFEHFQFE